MIVRFSDTHMSYINRFCLGVHGQLRVVDKFMSSGGIISVVEFLRSPLVSISPALCSIICIVALQTCYA